MHGHTCSKSWVFTKLKRRSAIIVPASVPGKIADSTIGAATTLGCDVGVLENSCFSYRCYFFCQESDVSNKTILLALGLFY